MKNINFIFLLVLFIGCKAIPPEIKNPKQLDKSHDIAVFIDGTYNTSKSNTNVRQLYVKSLQKDNQLSFYTVGVGGGRDFRWMGNFFGTGIGDDVRESYLFICENYKKNRNDRLHFFGFSRGAYTARILTNLIYVAGVLEIGEVSRQDQIDIIKEIYRAYRNKGGLKERQVKVNKVISNWEKKLNTTLRFQQDVNVETLNLFDTVEALTFPDFSEDFCYPNSRHLDQFVNVNNVNHAMSLDDNRACLFTPILASCSKMKYGDDVNTILNEVWFAGAHADIGGGYKEKEDNKLANVSLKWMMSELKNFNLFREIETDSTDIQARIHDPESVWYYKPFVQRRERDIVKYLETNGSVYNDKKIKIHISVIERLESGSYDHPKLSNKHNKKAWFDRGEFSKCFKKDGTKRIYQEDSCRVIDVIYDKE